MTTLLKIVLFVAPLALDSFALAAALGTERPTRSQRIRLTSIFVLFEGGMPIVGLMVGAPIAHLLGSAADYVAGAALLAVGGWMLLSDDDEEGMSKRFLDATGFTVLALGLGISLDEMAIGFTLGLSQLPVVGVIIAIAVQALVATQIGFAIGTRIGEKWREGAEKLAGVILVVLGFVMIFQRIIG